MIKLNDKHLVEKIDFSAYQEKVSKIHKMIDEETGAGNDYIGWSKYPLTYDKEEFQKILESAKYIRENFDVLVVCGIGGSYLGARAVVEAINGLHGDKKPEIIFFGQTFSSDYLYEVIEHIKDKKFAVNVISKSGTTTETAIAFRILKNMLEKKLGKEGARKAIFATTDKEKGALRKLATKEGYVTFNLPSNIGGRYSVFTAVGLLPIACAGIDIEAFMDGAKSAQKELNVDYIESNPAYKYAVIRDSLYRKGKSVEMLISYEPRLVQLGEWYKQLFGESEGKERKGLLPTFATFSTDLHSLGQFIQDGSKVMFETVLFVKKPMYDVTIPEDELNLDELNYLAGKSLGFVNEKAFEGTLQAHEEVGKNPNVVLEVEKLDEFTLGYVMYFFMKACGMCLCL